MLFRFLTLNNSILSCMAKRTSCEEAAFLENWTTFVWHVYSSSSSEQPSFRQPSLKEMFSILSNNNCVRLIKYLTHIKGMFHKFNKTFLKKRLYSFKRVLHAYSIPYVKTMFDGLWVLRCTFFKLQYFSRGELPTPKGVILKIWFVVLDEYHIMHSEKCCAILKDIFCVLTYTVPCVLHVRKHIVKRALHVQEASFLT